MNNTTYNNVTLEFFKSVSDYYLNKCNCKKIKVSRKDLVRYAISIGEFSNTTLDDQCITFYTSLVNMAFYESKDKFIMGNSYKNAETTIKTSIGFLIGMISAKCVAEKEFKIDYLFHLKDPNIDYSSSGKVPDFFGIAPHNNGHKAYIIEAKGTVMKRVGNNRVTHAKNQTESVTEIKLDDGKNVITYNNFKRHVVTSSQRNDEYIISDIDPDENNGNKKIYINQNLAYFNYYRNIFNFLNNNEQENFKTGSLEFIVVRTTIGKIGIDKNIYSILKDYQDIFSQQSLFSKKVLNSKNQTTYTKGEKLEKISGLSEKIKKLDNFYKYFEVMENNQDISLGYDGIILYDLTRIAS